MKLTQGGVMTMDSDATNMVEAFDGSKSDVASPVQDAHDTNWAQLQPQVSYNIISNNLSGTQKLMLYAAFAGVIYFIYKKFKR